WACTSPATSLRGSWVELRGWACASRRWRSSTAVTTRPLPAHLVRAHDRRVLREHVRHFPGRQLAVPDVREEVLRDLAEVCFVPHRVARRHLHGAAIAVAC